MISIEEYSFHYEMYLAESELFSSLIQIGGIYVNESTGLLALNEGVKETVLNYLEKIWTGIQNVWKKFTEICTKEADKIYLKSIADKMQNPTPDFTITNFTSYDMNKIEQLKLVQFNYEEMKESLENKDDFIQKYHQYLTGEGSISEKISNFVKSGVSDKKVDSALLKEMYKFCLTDFGTKAKSVEDQMKTIENSKKNIETLMNSINPAESTTEAVLLYESYITEEESKAMGFKDGENGPNPNDNNSGQGKAKTVRLITNYMSIETDILSGRLKALKDCYNSYMKTIKHYIKPEKKKEEEKK